MLNQKLQQKLLQKLSPQQIQLIKLLELPTIQLEQRIKKELEENPILEELDEDENDRIAEREAAEDDRKADDMDLDRDEKESTNDEESDEMDDREEVESPEVRSLDEFSLEDYMDDDDDTPTYKLSANNQSKDDKQNEIPFSVGSSFHENLLDQLGLRDVNPRQRTLAEFIIGNIDEDGYLRRDLDSMTDDIAFAANISCEVEELQSVLTLVQDLEPAGVGAKDLQECLLIQLQKRLEIGDGREDGLKCAIQILSNFFIEFTKKHYDKIMSKLDIEEDELKDAIDEILKLNPKPGSGFANPMSKTAQHITPDFYLEEVDGELTLNLNARNVPELRINRHYAEMLEGTNSKTPSRSDKDTIAFVKQKMDSAKWFIDAIKQRQNTLLVSMKAIIDYQKEYFKSGDETKLRPMILKDIAEKTKLDISTISRVANSKYIQTHFGIYPLKYFFSEGMQTESGEEVSTREIKKILQECIANESKRRPLTDERLAKILQDRGYQIARRTVAKYREQMNILVARLRKELQ